MTGYEASWDMRGGFKARALGPELALLLAGVVVLALTGPFATYAEQDGPARLIYWGRTMAAGWLVYRPALGLAGPVARRLRAPEALVWGAVVALMSAPMSVWLWYCGPQPDWSRPPPSLRDALDTWRQVVILAALYAAALWGLRGRRPQAAAEAPDAPPRLLSRLPASLGDRIVALRSEDHYVRIYTERGDHLILSRLSDAIAAMAGVEGAQVHKSWWIARAAVSGVEGSGRDIRFRLAGGVVAPVSRTRLRPLRETGWL